MADDRTPAAAGAGIATPVLATYLGHRFPEAGWSRTEHYAWMSELLGELGILTLDSLEELLNPDTEAVNRKMDYRFPAGRGGAPASTMRCCRRSVIATSVGGQRASDGVAADPAGATADGAVAADALRRAGRSTPPWCR